MSFVSPRYVSSFGGFEFSDEEFILEKRALLVRYADENNWRQTIQQGEDDQFASL